MKTLTLINMTEAEKYYRERFPKVEKLSIIDTTIVGLMNDFYRKKSTPMVKLNEESIEADLIFDTLQQYGLNVVKASCATADILSNLNKINKKNDV